MLGFIQNHLFSHSFEFTDTQVKDYHEKPSDHDESVLRIIETGFFKDSHKILDIGCGDGKLTALFAVHLPNASVIGCDVSPKMIDYARKHYTSNNLTFIEKSAENLDFETQFDTIISFNCLHWIQDQKRAFHQILQALKPGGKALLVATPASPNNDFKTICRNVILSFRWLFSFLTFRSVHSFHTEQEYKELLTNAGFLIDKVKSKQVEMVFKDRDELDPFLKAILTPLQHLDPRDQPAFLEDFFQELSKQGRVAPDGSIHIFFDQIELFISKDPT
jgi:trans-aconitate methyltransferase